MGDFSICTRRFRLCPVKNQERRKRKQLSLVVSIPRHCIHVVGMLVCDERVPKHESPEPSLPASLPVSFPLSVFKDLKTSSSNELVGGYKCYLFLHPG